MESNRLDIAFEDNLDELQQCCQSYDLGDVKKAKPISNILRLFCKTGGKTRSLLAQKYQEQEEKFLSTCTTNIPTNLLPFAGLICFSVGGSMAVARPHCISKFPVQPRRMRFSAWWEEIVFKKGDEEVSRSKLVLTMCEQDGGTHFDENLDETYMQIVSGTITGFVLSSGGKESHVNQCHSAAVRQIAEELYQSLRHQPTNPNIEKISPAS